MSGSGEKTSETLTFRDSSWSPPGSLQFTGHSYFAASRELYSILSLAVGTPRVHAHKTVPRVKGDKGQRKMNHRKKPEEIGRLGNRRSLAGKDLE